MKKTLTQAMNISCNTSAVALKTSAAVAQIKQRGGYIRLSVENMKWMEEEGYMIHFSKKDNGKIFSIFVMEKHGISVTCGSWNPHFEYFQTVREAVDYCFNH